MSKSYVDEAVDTMRRLSGLVEWQAIEGMTPADRAKLLTDLVPAFNKIHGEGAAKKSGQTVDLQWKAKNGKALVGRADWITSEDTGVVLMLLVYADVNEDARTFKMYSQDAARSLNAATKLGEMGERVAGKA